MLVLAAVWNYYNSLILISQKGGVIGIDVVDEMLEASQQKFY